MDIRACLRRLGASICVFGCVSAAYGSKASPPPISPPEPNGAVIRLITQGTVYTLAPNSSAPNATVPLNRIQMDDRAISPQGFARLVLPAEPLQQGSIPPDSTGLRFRFESEQEGVFTAMLTVTDDSGQVYASNNAYIPTPSNRLVTLNFPFSAFHSTTQKGVVLPDSQSIRSVSAILLGHYEGDTVYADDIQSYIERPETNWIDFATNQTDELCQPGTPVQLIFTPSQPLPRGVAGFHFDIQDFAGNVIQAADVPLDDRTSYSFGFVGKDPGYYEAHAYWIDAGNKKLQSFSCIGAEGTLPSGLGTFSILPTTLAQNEQRFATYNWDSFFGSQCSSHNIDQLMGLAWTLDAFKWKYIEPVKPVAANTSAWYQTEIAKAPRGDSRPSVGAFTSNTLGSPTWATYADKWADYGEFVRSCVDAQKHRFPNAPARYYGGAWEVNTLQLSNQDIVELYKQTSAFIHNEDPNAVVMGPSTNVLNMDWFESLFKLGILDDLDGIDTHAYPAGSYTPEHYGYDKLIQKLNALVVKYKGKPLPIFITELGIYGILGSEPDYKSQAERMARTAIILKGEGVRAFFPFYGIDNNRTDEYGFQFNKDVDTGNYAKARVSPKPVINAMATCAMELEGAKPLRRVSGLPSGVWAYEFAMPDHTVTAVWRREGDSQVSLPTGSAAAATVVDIMGRKTTVPCANGAIAVEASPSPLYIEVPITNASSGSQNPVR